MTEFDQPTIIRIETYGGEVVTEVRKNRSDLDIHEMFGLIRRVLLGHGYAEESVKEYLGE